MRIFADALRPDSKDMSSDQALMYAYGLYLNGGGRPDDFLNMDIDDIQTLILVHDADRAKKIYGVLKGIAKMMGVDE